MSSSTVTEDPGIDQDEEFLVEPVADTPWYARQYGTGILLVITGLVGLTATLILFYERILLWLDPDHVTSCDLSVWVSCGTVMESWQASVFGFPNHFIGLLGFPVVITLGMALIGRAQFARWFWLAANAGVVFGAVFCIWLWTQAVYSINTLCLYCMVVWTVVIPMAVFVTVRNIIHGVIPAGPKVRTIAPMLAWPVILVTYTVIAASIMLRFGAAMF